VSLGWGEDPDAGVALLRDALPAAEALGDLDELFRVYANLTTVLDLLGRRGEAVKVAAAGIEAARRADLEAVYGNFLRGNAAESLFLLGRWSESRAQSSTALEWSSAGVAFVNSIVNLAIVEVESRAGELASRLLGQLLLELETVRDSQHAVPVYRASASFALWRGDLVDARRAADRGWRLLDRTEDWVLTAKMAATVAEVEAAAGDEAVARRDLAGLAAARERSSGVVREAAAAVERSGVRRTIGSRREADAYLAAAAAHDGRLQGRDDPAAWDRLAARWIELTNPYETARARWRHAAALLASGAGRAGRADAREPLLEAVAVALELGARPLLRDLRDLAGRALINLPAEVEAMLGEPIGVVADGHEGNGALPGGASPLVRGLLGEAAPPRSDTFGLSSREREVLALIAEGRTNREIGERLFISQKTVGVHVGRILDKLNVSGRVEAAAVAIRLGLVGKRVGR
jgi:DNA-binding CsgD family transcriptional regulator